MKRKGIKKIITLSTIVGASIFLPTNSEERIPLDKYYLTEQLSSHTISPLESKSAPENTYDLANKNSTTDLDESSRNEFLVDSILNVMKPASSVVNNYLIKSSIKVESNHNPNAEYKSKSNNKVSKGLMQMVESTWKEFGEGPYSNAFIPSKNIAAGIRYYLWLENFIAHENPKWKYLATGDKQNLVVAAYNAGPYLLKGNNWNLNLMPKMTKTHINKIKNEITALKKNQMYSSSE